MARLTESVQAFIVQRLAMFDGPKSIVEAVKDEFDTAVSTEQVRHYDPDRPDTQVAEKWRTLHAETRRTFLDETAKIPVVHRAVRMRKLHRYVEAAERARNYPLAAQLLEQAAKEVGDAFTNRRVMGGAVGTYNLAAATDEQVDRIANGEDPVKVIGGGRAGGIA